MNLSQKHFTKLRTKDLKKVSDEVMEQHLQ